MKKKELLSKPVLFAAGFALLNIVMYLSISKFWIGGSSFLPLVGKFGPGMKFLFAFAVNVGVVIGSFLSAFTSNEFLLRWPSKNNLWKMVLGGFFVGIGITLAPGTCTTSFVVGVPMLSVSSFLSIAGMFIGGWLVYSLIMRPCLVRK